MSSPAPAITADANSTFSHLREDFPILSREINGKPLVYLDNAATTQKPNAVIDAISGYYRNSNSNVHRGVHSLSEEATAKYEGARDSVKRMLNAEDRAEIILTSGTTQAVNLVAQSYARAQLKKGDEIIVSEMEHHSNIVPWQLACEQTGAILKVIPFDDNGELLFDEYLKLLNERTRLVAVVHVSNALGTVNPVKAIVAAAHEQGAVVLLDGAQATAHTSVDVQDLDCDFYALSGHKMFGPTGVGVLYGRRELLEAMPPYQGGGDMIRTVRFDKSTYNDLPYKFEAGTPNIAGTIGLGAAVEYLAELDMSMLADYEDSLLQHCVTLAASLPGLRIIGNAAHKAAVFSFTLDGVHPHDLGTILDNDGIAIRAGHHCAMPVMEHYGVPATARASFAFYNTHEEVEKLFAGLAKARELFA
jgi:cysteine desulfurase/selenocysteine lyase